MDTTLPISRVRTIMKSSLDTGKITTEVLFAMAKSTEYFIESIAKGAYKANSNNILKYENLSSYVHEMDNLEFLLQIVPEKIKVKDFRTLEHIKDSDNSSECEDL